MKKYNSFDLFKFVMAIFVVAIHTTNLQQNSFLLFPLILRFAVPFFLMCSGYLLVKKINIRNLDETIVYKDYIIKIVKLYIIWSIIYLPITIYHFIYGEHIHSTLVTLLGILKNYVFIGEQYYSWPLWYLLATIYSYLIVLMFRKFKHSYKTILFVSIFLFIIGAGYSACIDNLEKLPSNFANFFDYLIPILGQSGRNLTSLFYIVIGILISNGELKVNFKVLIPLTFIIFMFCLFIDIEFVRALLYILLFILITKMNLNNSEIFFKLRKSSSIIYFTHMLVFFIYSLIVGFDNCKGVIGFFVTFATTILLSFVIISINRKKDIDLLNIIF